VFHYKREDIKLKDDVITSIYD